MAKKKTPPASPEPILSDIPMPVGMDTVRQKVAGTGLEPTPPPTGGKIKMKSASAGTQARHFNAGGEAFAVWCLTKGIPTYELRSAEEWDELLVEFSERPIHGCRRSTNQATHTPDPSRISG